MWVKANPNPGKKNVPDCMIRAICIALNMPWKTVHKELCQLSGEEYSVPNDDYVWGKYLYSHGFQPFLVHYNCPVCITIDMFTKMYPKGTYIIGTGSHAVAVIDGDYYDSWDSGNETPSFFWEIT